jgi:hypothetical protein
MVVVTCTIEVRVVRLVPGEPGDGPAAAGPTVGAPALAGGPLAGPIPCLDTVVGTDAFADDRALRARVATVVPVPPEIGRPETESEGAGALVDVGATCALLACEPPHPTASNETAPPIASAISDP